MKTKTGIWLLIVWFAIVGTTIFGSPGVCPAADDSKEVIAEGVGAVTVGNQAKARDEAMRDAMRKAIEQAVGTMISSETIVENFQLLSDKIYSQTSGYVRTYQVVSEGAEGELYRIRIKAEVSLTQIKNDLAAIGLLLEAKHMPRMMVMIAEQNVGEVILHYWWNPQAASVDLGVTENSLISEFQEKGFHFVDPEAVKKEIKVSKAFRAEDLTEQQVKTLGAQADADVVIFGKALAKLSGSVAGTSMKSVQANISLKAVDADTGRILATAQESASGVHIDEVTAGTNALKQAAKKTAQALMDKILKGWGKEVAGSAQVRLSIKGVKSYADLSGLFALLRKEIRGVDAVHQRSISNDGVAEVDIEYRGDGQSLADELLSKSLPGFTIKITNVTVNRVEITLEKTEGK
ncbi:MAG: flagellar assembly protein T N-terminal domain-containing protein [Proteobacteria bacterium]|jgi:hypothetical protein|nr:flagellar assembly protein T N-terminal domain-containing protein [Pseudomonadota bacterium]